MLARGPCIPLANIGLQGPGAHAEGVVGVAVERGALVDVAHQRQRQHQAQVVARANLNPIGSQVSYRVF